MKMRKNDLTFNGSEYVLMIILLMITLTVKALGPTVKAPQWLTKGETFLNSQRSNESYYFKIITNVGTDINSLQQGSVNALADYIGKRNKVQGMEITEIENDQIHGDDVTTREYYQMMFKNEFTTDIFYASLVDQYWEVVESSNGRYYQYYALYAVSASGNMSPLFDHFEKTRSYGPIPIAMSIIPGAGQLYKGQKAKGFLMMGAAIAGTSAIIYTANRCAYYKTRIEEQPKFAHDYSKKRDNFTTWRNIAIGATGALVIWSILDAALTPGTTRIKVSPSSSLGIRPLAMYNVHSTAVGLSLSLSF